MNLGFLGGIIFPKYFEIGMESESDENAGGDARQTSGQNDTNAKKTGVTHVKAETLKHYTAVWQFVTQRN